MSESMQERTEEASPKRRADAREEGRIARSQELPVAAGVLAGAVVITSMGGSLVSTLATTMTGTITAAATPPSTIEDVTNTVQQLALHVLSPVVGIIATMAVVSAIVGAAQARGVFSTKTIAPDWSRISPAKNAANLFGARPFIELFKSVLKLVIIGAAVYSTLGSARDDIMQLGSQPVQAIGPVIVHHAVHLCVTAGLSYLALAAADYGYQLWKHEGSLRMTRQEVKMENKQSEGDPMLKARRRTLGRARARQQMFADVKGADIVITNPTHIAIALRYDPTIAPAPVVLAMGQRKVAERIKALAASYGVPMVENRPLARALLASATVGTVIPADLYSAVAEVLAFVLRQRAGSAGYRPKVSA